jgi:predicted Rossmann-fold nucleotide-binding protein
VRCSDAVAVVGGSWGTLSEAALAVRTGLPVVSLRGWSVADDDGAPAGSIAVAGSPAEAVAVLFAQLDSEPPVAADRPRP